MNLKLQRRSSLKHLTVPPSHAFPWLTMFPAAVGCLLERRMPAIQDQLFSDCIPGVGRLHAWGCQGFPLLADGLAAHSHSGLPLGKG